MQPNWPSSGSRGRASPGRAGCHPCGVVCSAVVSAPLHSRRSGPARDGGVRGEEDGRVGGAAGPLRRVGGELRAVRSAGRGSTEESGGLFHPGSAGLALGRGRSASVRSASAPRDCSQCPVSVCGSGREVASRLALRSLGQPSASFDPS